MFFAFVSIKCRVDSALKHPVFYMDTSQLPYFQDLGANGKNILVWCRVQEDNELSQGFPQLHSTAHHVLFKGDYFLLDALLGH